MGIVAIVPAKYAPQSNSLISWRHREGAASKQAALTAGSGTAATMAVAAVAAPIAVPVVILSGVIATGIMSVVDAARITSGIVPEKTAEEIESAINRAVIELDVQNMLAGKFTTIIKSDPRIQLAKVSAAWPDKPDAQPDYTQLRTDGVDTVIEVTINEIGFDGCILNDWECQPPHVLNLFMRAQVRLVRVADGAVLFARPLKYTSGNHELAMWIADSGRLLNEEFELAYRELAERIYDEVFLITAIALPFRGGMYEPRCWLEPIYPKPYARVDTLQPTLRWTAFPREIDRQKLDPVVLGKISDVTYDLRIWDQAAELRKHSFTEQWRNRIIYERTGLAEPQHTLEVALTPSSAYYWSVRARFVVDGRPMATRWAQSNRDCQSEDKVLFLYHKFGTPK